MLGANESDMRTLQLDGVISLVEGDWEFKKYDEIYLGKFPEKVEKSKAENFVRFKFEPTWWRYTDWTGPEGKKIISSK